MFSSSSVGFAPREGVPGGFEIEDLGVIDVKGRPGLHVFAVAAARVASCQSPEPVGAADVPLCSLADGEATKDSMLALEARSSVLNPQAATVNLGGLRWRISRSFRFDSAGAVSLQSSSGSANISVMASNSGSCRISSDAQQDVKHHATSALNVRRRCAVRAGLHAHADNIDVSLLRICHRPFWYCACVSVLVYACMCVCVYVHLRVAGRAWARVHLCTLYMCYARMDACEDTCTCTQA